MKATFLNTLSNNSRYHKGFVFIPTVILTIEKYSLTISAGFLMLVAEFEFNRKVKPF